MPQTSIQVPYNRKIHFIWWGNPKGNPSYEAAALDGPNELAQQISRQSSWVINYWYQEEYHSFFNRKLNSEIQRRPVANRDVLAATDLTAAEQGGFRDEHPDLVAFLPRVIQGLAHFKAYSAVVDLLQMVVLYMEGGYYFDTTIHVPDHEVFLHELAAEQISPRLIEQKQSAGGTGFGFKNQYDVIRQHRAPEFDVPHFDYWVLTSRPVDPVVESMIDQYLTRCAYGGIVDEGKRIRRLYVSNKNPQRLVDTAVGHLIADSVWQGMYLSKKREIETQQIEPNEMNRMVFEAMMSHSWPLLRKYPVYRIIRCLLPNNRERNESVIDQIAASPDRLIENLKMHDYSSSISPLRGFIREVLISSGLIEEVETYVADIPRHAGKISSIVYAGNQASMVTSLLEHRNDAIRLLYDDLKDQSLFEKLFERFEITDISSFHTRILAIIPPGPISYQWHGWHPRYKVFKYNASTWRVS